MSAECIGISEKERFNGKNAGNSRKFCKNEALVNIANTDHTRNLNDAECNVDTQKIVYLVVKMSVILENSQIFLDKIETKSL